MSAGTSAAPSPGAANDADFGRDLIEPRLVKRGNTWFVIHPHRWASGSTRDAALAAWRGHAT